jgi:hypothetical protein
LQAGLAPSGQQRFAAAQMGLRLEALARVVSNSSGSAP